MVKIFKNSEDAEAEIRIHDEVKKYDFAAVSAKNIIKINVDYISEGKVDVYADVSELLPGQNFLEFVN